MGNKTNERKKRENVSLSAQHIFRIECVINYIILYEMSASFWRYKRLPIFFLALPILLCLKLIHSLCSCSKFATRKIRTRHGSRRLSRSNRTRVFIAEFRIKLPKTYFRFGSSSSIRQTHDARSDNRSRKSFDFLQISKTLKTICFDRPLNRLLCHNWGR